MTVCACAVESDFTLRGSKLLLRISYEQGPSFNTKFQANWEIFKILVR